MALPWEFRSHQSADAISLCLSEPRTPSLFFSRPLLAGLGGSRGLDRRARAPDAIVATSSPHLCYLLTGRRAVLPPMEIDPAHARRLLEAVPVSYVIVDEFSYPIDSSRRYALPAVESHPASWRVVHAIDGTRIYEHTAGTQ